MHIRGNSFIGGQINSFVLHKGRRRGVLRRNLMFSFAFEKGKSKIFNEEKARNELMIMKEFEKCCRTLKKDGERES